MNKLDWKILQVLDWNGREHINKIAKAVHSNKDVVAYHIKKLEEQKTITRYYPVLDMGALGYTTSRLYFDLEETNSGEEEGFLTFLDKEINAGLIFRMDYPYRYGIFLWTKRISEIEQAIFQIKSKLGKKLIRYHHSIINTFRQYPKDYLWNNKMHKTNHSLEPKDTEPYDQNDFNILKELSKNARISTVQIAKNLKIPQTTVSSKIKNLEKRKIILGYRAEINFIKLGYMNYFLEVYLDTNDNLKQIETWADTNKNVVWLQKIIGTCDIEIEVEVKDRVELESLLNEFRSTFKNIRKIVFWSQEYKKLTFLP